MPASLNAKLSVQMRAVYEALTQALGNPNFPLPYTLPDMVFVLNTAGECGRLTCHLSTNAAAGQHVRSQHVGYCLLHLIVICAKLHCSWRGARVHELSRKERASQRSELAGACVAATVPLAMAMRRLQTHGSVHLPYLATTVVSTSEAGQATVSLQGWYMMVEATHDHLPLQACVRSAVPRMPIMPIAPPPGPLPPTDNMQRYGRNTHAPILSLQVGCDWGGCCDRSMLVAAFSPRVHPLNAAAGSALPFPDLNTPMASSWPHRPLEKASESNSTLLALVCRNGGGCHGGGGSRTPPRPPLAGWTASWSSPWGCRLR